MPPKSCVTVSQRQLTTQIYNQDFVSPTPCDFCVLHDQLCFQILEEGSKLKCAKCTCCGKSCVFLFWKSLNIVQDNLCEDVATEEAM